MVWPVVSAHAPARTSAKRSARRLHGVVALRSSLSGLPTFHPFSRLRLDRPSNKYQRACTTNRGTSIGHLEFRGQRAHTFVHDSLQVSASARSHHGLPNRERSRRQAVPWYGSLIQRVPRSYPRLRANAAGETKEGGRGGTPRSRPQDVGEAAVSDRC